MGGTIDKEAEAPEAGEEESNEAKEEHEEESNAMPEPPPPGRILLRGAFAGTMLTTGHCLETSLPLDYEIPIEAARPLFEAIAQAQKEVEEKESQQKLEEEELKKKTEEEGEEEKELTEEEEEREAWKTVLASSETWDKLLDILDGDSVDMDKLLSEGHFAHEEGRRAQAYKAELKALRVDYAVLDKRKADLESETGRLQVENENLQKELDHPAHGKRSRKASDEIHGHRGGGVDKEELEELSVHLGDLQHNREEKEKERQKRREHKYSLSGPSLDAHEALGGPQGWLQLKGTFVGTVKTEEHALDIAVPLTGDLPLWLVLTTVQELKAGSKAALEEQEEKKLAKEQERLKAKADDGEGEGEGDEDGEEGEEKEREDVVTSPEVWAELFKLLGGTKPMDTGHQRAGMGLGLAGPAGFSGHGNEPRATALAPKNGMDMADIAAEIVAREAMKQETVSQEAVKQFQDLKYLTEVNNEVLQSIAKTEQEVLTLRKEFDERMRMPKQFATMPAGKVPRMTVQPDAVLRPATLPAALHHPSVPQLPLQAYPPPSENSQPGSRTQSARGLGGFRQKKMASALSMHLQELERCASELNSLSHGNL